MHLEGSSAHWTLIQFHSYHSHSVATISGKLPSKVVLRPFDWQGGERRLTIGQNPM